ncbi:hypothetical protein XELAEV_18017513mg [Xenopus laevis]|uniref:Uncharacterized protein n=1 Tax=Xenopus laevis TaxID=8355 RepID=A0A974DBC3_XENLA|nr:hypothetical protein XELAEV_18017513mg [Xenopus laevis]
MVSLPAATFHLRVYIVAAQRGYLFWYIHITWEHWLTGNVFPVHMRQSFGNPTTLHHCPYNVHSDHTNGMDILLLSGMDLSDHVGYNADMKF